MTDLTVTEAEHEFLKAFVTILEHLKNRAIRAEREVKDLQRELTALRDKVEYLTTEASLPTLAKTLGDIGRNEEINDTGNTLKRP